MTAKVLIVLMLLITIADKESSMVNLQKEVEDAQKYVGLAETMGYVEKIGLIQQLKDQIYDLEAQKAALEAK